MKLGIKMYRHSKLHTRVTPGNWTCVRAEDSSYEICYKTNMCDIYQKPHMRGIWEREHVWLPITCLDIKFEAMCTAVIFEKRNIRGIWDSPPARIWKCMKAEKLHVCVWYARNCMCKTSEEQRMSNIWISEQVLCLRNCICFSSERQTSLPIVTKVIKQGCPTFLRASSQISYKFRRNLSACPWEFWRAK